MSNPFFDHPILNSPYAFLVRHWELDKTGQPTQKVVEKRQLALRIYRRSSKGWPIF